MSQYDPTVDLKVNVGHCDLYFMVSGFMLHLEDNLMYGYHSLGFSSVILSYISHCLMPKYHIYI